MSEIKKCFLCGYDKAEYEGVGIYDDDFCVRCERCGTYWGTKQFFWIEEKKIVEIGYILSGLSRELQENNTLLRLNTKNAESYAKDHPVPDVNNPEEKAAKFLQRLRHLTEYPGQGRIVNLEMDYPLAYAKNRQEFVYLLNFLKEKKLIEFEFAPDLISKGQLEVTLLIEGWNLTSKLATVNKDSKQGFIAIWFDDSMNESIAAIEEGVRAAGFTPICIKGELFPERIMDKALSEIRKSLFVVVDLSGNRPSVFFEAGFAHGLDIEAIYVYRELPEKDPLEFYVKHYQCYKYDSPQDLNELVKNAITARISKKQN